MNHNLKADPLMPSAEVAWSSSAMLAVFRNTFTQNSKNRWTIEQCKLSRFRYRPEMRSVVLYELDLKDSDTGMSCWHWVTVSLYPGKRARRRYDQLIAEGVDKVGDLCGWPFEPVVYLAELRMLVQVYPVDRYLPTLPLLLRKEASTLDELIMRVADKGMSSVVQHQIEPSRYRPGFGSTLRYSVEIKTEKTQTAKHTVYVKVYREASEAKSAFQSYRDIGAQLRSCVSGFRMIDSIGCLPEHRAMVLPEAPGRSLQEILNGSKGNLAVAVRRTATATAALHASFLKLTRIASDEQMRAGAQRNAEFIAWAYPTLATRVRRLASRKGNGEYAPAHMDLKPDHVFLDDNNVTFIDLDSMAMANPVFDIAMLAVRLRAMPDVLRFKPQMANSAVQNLLETYFGKVPGEWRTHWPTAVAYATLKVALFYVKHLVEDWSNKVEKLVVLSEATGPYEEGKDPWSQ